MPSQPPLLSHPSLPFHSPLAIISHPTCLLCFALLCFACFAPSSCHSSSTYPSPSFSFFFLSVLQPATYLLVRSHITIKTPSSSLFFLFSFFFPPPFLFFSVPSL
ncbi:uncharacterized protein AKAW2_10317S [Aspergillus luchuensis]|uniref:Uncharacterized protein n=1 Tax=Aspergillus kawachii TaxID=1069201 RepID=A0A7R7VYW5_ASPKA|nr:uncharacterized protein AKAW2_10317S [Aspergillus luchuensis]BCR93271.1 hypothetical protein AKAW2_10317S [Aspergillus luchuensis]BCS05921.1 hypothetical protein ALUC_10302S [Aspergillus luchuensis]